MLVSFHWMTGGALGFQFDDTDAYDEELDDLVLMNCLFLYLGILEIQILWDKKQQEEPYDERNYPEE